MARRLATRGRVGRRGFGSILTATRSTPRCATLDGWRFQSTNATSWPDDTLLAFFSGSKGFHVGLPTALWSPEPSPTFHRVCRRFAEAIAEVAGVAIDSGVYDAVRAFRAPNSRHPKTGLHKRRLSLDELLGLSLERIVELAAEAGAIRFAGRFGATPGTTAAMLAARLKRAARRASRQSKAKPKAERRAAGNEHADAEGRSTLRIRLQWNRGDNGDRHRLLFSAAANLGEFRLSAGPGSMHAC